MKQSVSRELRPYWFVALGLAGFVLLSPVEAAAVGPSAEATAAFNQYAAGVEARLAGGSAGEAGWSNAEDASRLIQGQLLVDDFARAKTAMPSGAMLHHWRGRAFVPSVTADDFQRIMRDFARYPKFFSPEVRTAVVLAHDADRYKVSMRVEQKHIMTVVMDTAYDVTFNRLNAHEGLSFSRSYRIDEIEAPGTAKEHGLDARQGHGFLWRQNTYWSYQERDGGLFIEVESLSLSRSIPIGLDWAIGPFVDSVPRESLEFTLRAVSAALRQASSSDQAKH